MVCITDPTAGGITASYAMLGDIHKTDQKVDNDGREKYPGSLVQQNHGESIDKGYLIWDIKDKNTWSTRHVSLVNPKPFITIELTRKGRMPKNTSIPNGARLRLVSNNNLPLDIMRKAVDIAKHRFKPESISFLNRASGERGSVEGLTDDLRTENLRDIDVQEELIDEYLVEYQVPPETMEKVYELNKKYNKIVISPGPGNPDKAGNCLNIVKKLYKKMPILGVCLGHQIIGQVFGSKIIQAKKLMHGKTSIIFSKKKGILKILRLNELHFSKDKYDGEVHSFVTGYRQKLREQLIKLV